MAHRRLAQAAAGSPFSWPSPSRSCPSRQRFGRGLDLPGQKPPPSTPGRDRRVERARWPRWRRRYDVTAQALQRRRRPDRRQPAPAFGVARSINSPSAGKQPRRPRGRHVQGAGQRIPGTVALIGEPALDDLVDRVRLWDERLTSRARVAVAAVEAGQGAGRAARPCAWPAERKRAVGLLAQVGRGAHARSPARCGRGQSLLAAAQARVRSLVKQAEARRGGGRPGGRQGGRAAAAAAARKRRQTGTNRSAALADDYSPQQLGSGAAAATWGCRSRRRT